MRNVLSVLVLIAALPGCSTSTTGGHDSGLDAGVAMDAHPSDAPAVAIDAPASDAPVRDATTRDANMRDARVADARGNDAMAVDSGPGAPWDTCAVTSDCTLVPSGCCATCAIPELSDVDAVSTEGIEAHYDEVCPVPMPCPRCASRENPDLVATCDAAHCSALDVSTLPLSACSTDADCFVRYATCCGCTGDPFSVLGIRADSHGALDLLLCDGGSCDTDCIPTEDAGYVARCDLATNHCVAMAL